LFKIAVIIVFVLLAKSVAFTQVDFMSFKPICNEITLYQNFFDDGDNAGQTLQILSINSLRLFTDFNIEFVADFNREKTPGKNNDYYMEIGIVKPVWKKISVNCQRIYGTFIDKPVNQIGCRYSF